MGVARKLSVAIAFILLGGLLSGTALPLRASATEPVTVVVNHTGGVVSKQNVDAALRGLTGPFAVTVAAGATEIAPGAFGYYAWHSADIISITMPDGVISLGEKAFAYCRTLGSITLPDSITSVGKEAFSNCNALAAIDLPDSLVTIGASAFTCCYKLPSIAVPKGVAKIGDDAFSGCTMLSRIDVALENEYYSSDDGVFYNKEKSVVLSCPQAKTGVYSIPEGVITIADCAFSGCTELTEITLPSSLISIGENAFSSCVSLTSITIPDNVASIGDCAFHLCEKLVSVALSSQLTKLGYAVFGNCYALTDISIPNSVTKIDREAFVHCLALTDITVPNTVTSIGENAFYGCDAITIRCGENSTAHFYARSCGQRFALYVPPAYRIAFYVNGGSAVATQWVVPINCVAVPADPTKGGSLFGGWYSDKALTTLYRFSAPVSTDLRLYAKWNVIDTHITATDGKVDSKVNADNTITFTFTPSTGNKVLAVYVEGVSKPIAGSYTTKPGEVPETLVLVCGNDATHKSAAFTDMTQAVWAKNAVTFVTDRNFFGGTGKTTFGPNAPMTRGMFITVLSRQYGIDINKYKNQPFTDCVVGKDYFAEPAAWGEKTKLVGGVGNGLFAPDVAITREQMVAIMFRYAQVIGLSTSKRGGLSAYPDAAKVSNFAQDAFRWSVAEGLVSGSNGKLLPQGTASRAEVATILMRFCTKLK